MKKATTTNIYLVRRLYNLLTKEFESDLFQAHFNEYESINSHISAQGMKIYDELKALLFISSLNPLSCEKFVTIVHNVSATTVKYSEITSFILLEDTSRKTFVHESRSDAYVIQSSNDRPNNRGRSPSKCLTMQEVEASPGTLEHAIIAKNLI